MGSHPANLLLRFMLELVAFISVGIWGWKLGENWYRFVLALGIPIVLAIVWGTFAVPNDPSRSGGVPIATNGLVRLTIELGVFGFAVWALYNMGWTKTSLIIGLTVLIHYLLSYDRILWLLSR